MNLQPYPEYKDSGVPWLGKIPAHWELHRGKWLFQKMERPVRPQDEVVTCFRDGTVTLRKLRRTRGFTESLKEIGYQGIRKGDLVIHQMDAFAGAVGVSDSDGKGTPVYSVCLPKRDLDTHYYAQLVREMSRSEFITSLAKGIRERSTDFRFDTFASLMLPVPLPDEQKKIARFMRNESAQINKFIRNKRRLIELLKEQKQNIINQAVTRGIDPDVKLKPSGVEWIGDIPEHWEVRKLKHIAAMKSGDNLTSNQIAETGDYPVYGGNGLRGYFNSYNKDGRYLLVGRQGALCGNVHRVEGKFWATEHAVVTDVRPGISADWYYYMLTVMNLNQYSESAAQPGISVEKIQNLRTSLPLLEEQEAIVTHIEWETSTIDQTIARTEREIELMREYRTRLISDVVTGQVDVRGVEVPDIAGDDSVALDEGADEFEESEVAELEEEIEA